METRALLAFVISVAILIGYQALFAPQPRPPAPAGGEAVVDAARVPDEQPLEPTAPAEPRAAIPEHLLDVDTPLYRAVFTTRGARLKSFELKDHRLSADKNSPPLDMVSSSDGALPLGIHIDAGSGRVESDESVAYDVSGDGGSIGDGETRSLVFRGATASGAQLTKTVTLTGGSYVLDVHVQRSAGEARPLGIAWARRKPAAAGGNAAGIEGPAAYLDEKLHSQSIAGLEEPVTYQGTTAWAGYADHYFLAAYYPEEPRILRFVATARETDGEAVLWDDNAAGEVTYELFIGPKKIKLLNTLGHDLDEAVDLGYFAFVARPLLELMIFLYRFTHNYGWTIVLITVGIRLAFYPINKRQIEAMKAMQRIQPELKRIQEKFKDDREKLNKEMIEVYRRHKVNPLSGCLPMLVQLPVFLGLYNALMQSIELRHAPFIGWIHDLSLPDRLGALHIPFVDPPGVPVLTLLMGVSMFVQQKMTPSTADPVQQRMMMFLPAVFTLMFINFPSGLVLYWLANNVLSIAQQHLMTRGAA